MRVRDVLLPVGGAAWSVDKDFDVRRHVHQIRLPDGDFAAEAVAIAGELMERPLERGLPPWEMYLLTGEAATARSRSWSSSTTRWPTVCARSPSGPGSSTRSPTPAAVGAPPGASRAARVLAPGPGRWPAWPGAVSRSWAGPLGVGASVVRASRLDPRGVPALSAGSSGTRRLGTAVLDLDEVQRVRRAAGGTANDVLLAAVAGGLRRWLRDARRAAARTPTRAPSCPSPGAGPAARPDRATSSPRICSDCPSATRIRAHGWPPFVPPWTATRPQGPPAGPGRSPYSPTNCRRWHTGSARPLAGGAARMLFDILVTSVPLPRSALSLGGCPLREIYPMAPLARGQSLAIAMSTYGGRVHVGLVADGKAVPDLDRLARSLGEELDELLALSR